MKSHRAGSPSFSPLISFGNESLVLDVSGELPVGQIALANESRLAAATYSEGLTQYAVGWRDPENLMALTDYIAPPIPVGRRFEWKKAKNAESFLTETDDARGIGAGFKRVEYAGDTQLGKTLNRGLTYVLDTDEDGGAVPEESITAMLLGRIMRNKYRRAISALLGLSAGTAASFKSDTAPDELMRASLAAGQLDSGLYPNRGLMGLVAWNYRKAAYAVQNTAGGNAGLAKSQADVAADLMLDDLRVDKALYQQTGTVKDRVVGSVFIGFTARDGLTKDDPSNLKQFYTPTGGGRYRVFRKVSGPADKFVEITVEHYESIVGTSTVGVSRLNIGNT